MGAPVAVDVLHGFVQALDQLDGALQPSVFRAEGFGRRGTEREVLPQRWSRVDLDLVGVPPHTFKK